MSRETLEEVRDELGDPREGPEGVGGPTWRVWTGRGALGKV